jgi:predicted lipoprotein with Yx(FWY)xxD motif
MKLNRKSLVGTLAIAVLALAAVLAISSAAGASTKTVKTGHAEGKTVLVNRAGRTLYSLSAETNGRFICTSGCVSTWHPLTVRHGQKATGAHSLGTIRRPDGKTQVTYKGKPLYTFAGDQKPGDAKGEGFKDVGVWHAASVGSSTTKTPAATPQPTTSYPSYGNGGY